MYRSAITTPLVLLVIFSTTTFGQTVKDVTNDFKDHLNKQLIGIKFDQPLTTVEDHTSVHLGVKTGDQIKARGWAKFDSVTIEGALRRKDYPQDDFQGAYTAWAGDMKLTFPWSSDTHGERWVWPGGAFVDNVWDSLHPAGTCIVAVEFKPDGARIKDFEIQVSDYPGHDDRANNFISDRIIKANMRTAFLNQMKEYGIPLAQ